MRQTPHNAKRGHKQRRKAATVYRKPAPGGKHINCTPHERANRSCVMAPSKLVKQARKDVRKSSAAAHRLAEWYAEGEEGLDRDLSLWLRWEVEAAERGCADAQAALGYAYKQATMGLQADHATAFAWLRKAALQGRALHWSALFSLP